MIGCGWCYAVPSVHISQQITYPYLDILLV